MKKTASVLGRVLLGFIVFLTLIPFFLLLSLTCHFIPVDG